MMKRILMLLMSVCLCLSLCACADLKEDEEKAEFWIKKMTTKIEQITKELNSKQDFLWCYQDRDAFQVKYNDIFLIQVENEKTQI